MQERGASEPPSSSSSSRVRFVVVRESELPAVAYGALITATVLFANAALALGLAAVDLASIAERLASVSAAP